MSLDDQRTVAFVTTESGWERVRERMEQEVPARGGVRALERSSGVSATTITKLLHGERVSRRDRLAVLATHFGWLPDGFDRIRRGEDPAGGAATTLTTEDPGAVVGGAFTDLRHRVTRLEESVARQHETLTKILQRLDEGEHR